MNVRTIRLLVLATCCAAFVAAPKFSLAQAKAVWSASAVAQTNGTTVKMPLRRAVSRKSRLNLTIDTRWAQNYGYRPVEVTVSSPTPTVAEQTILMQLHAGWAGPIVVEHEFKMPAGATSASVRLPVPQYEMATPFYWWEVWVDEAKDDDLSLKQQDAWNVMQSGYGGNTLRSFLAIDPNAGQRRLVGPSSMEFEVLSIAVPEFPKRWIEYTCLDVITLSLSELQFVSKQNPDAFIAVKRWTRAGGQLWVNDVGGELEHLPELSQMFQLPANVGEPADVRNDGNPEAMGGDFQFANGWRAIRFRKENPEGQVVTFLNHLTGNVQTVRDPQLITRLQSDPNFSQTGIRYESAGENPVAIAAADSSEWFVEQRLGLGNIRAFREVNDVSQFHRKPGTANATTDPADAAATDPSAAADPNAQMPQSLTAALQTTARWSARHGIVPDSMTVEFANLLVPGVGMAPVTEFRILITLFVVVIGPLNYWLLKRWRRLHLMVLTVPLAAAAITLTLFVYAIAADGFGTKVRAHSFTALDQRTGEAACWSRLSYYSGLAPSGGLTLPADIAVYPIIPSWNEYSAQSHVRGQRDIVWEKDDAKLARGWLRSRTPMQYLTVRSRKSPNKLELTPVPNRMRAKNSLATEIEYVVVADKDGKFWSGEKLPVGETVFLAEVEQSAAAGRFRKLTMANSPQIPAALAGDDSQYTRNQRNQWRMTGQGIYAGEQSLAANLANDAIANLAGFAGGAALNLPPRSYLAVTNAGPEVEYGMDGVDEESSFHVIVGQW
jgi:hypothetical protein